MTSVTWSTPSLWLYGSRFQHQGISLLPVAAAVQGCYLWKVQGHCCGLEGQGGSGQCLLLCAEAAQPKSVRKHFMVTSPPPQFDAGPCLTLRPGLCSLSSAFIVSLSNFPAFHSRIIHAAVRLTCFWFQLPCKILERGIFCLSTFAVQVFPEKYKWRLFKR